MSFEDIFGSHESFVDFFVVRDIIRHLDPEIQRTESVQPLEGEAVGDEQEIPSWDLGHLNTF